MNEQLAAIIDALDENQLRAVVKAMAREVPSITNGRIAAVMQVALPPTEKYEPDNGEVRD